MSTKLPSGTAQGRPLGMRRCTGGGKHGMLCIIILYYIISYHIILHYITLYHIILYYIILYYILYSDIL